MIAVLGATGQVGTALMNRLQGDARGFTRSDMDLRDLDALGGWVSRLRPEVIVNCAAYTAVDAAETDEGTARNVNALAVGGLADAAANYGSRLVTFSTDYVFDGSKDGAYVENDEPHPLSVYGRTKREGEILALEGHDGNLVIRTSWVLSRTHRNFVSAILGRLRQGTVDVVDDQQGRPTIADDLATAVAECIQKDVQGLLHLTNQGTTTWFELARSVASLAGLDQDLVRPVSTSHFPRPAQRPVNSVLDSERLQSLNIDPLPHHLDSLPDVVAGLVDLGY